MILRTSIWATRPIRARTITTSVACIRPLHITARTYQRLHTSITDDEREALERSIQEYASEPPQTITLSELLRLDTRTTGTKSQAISKEDLLANASQVLHTLRVRLAHRLEALRSLQYMVVLNPHMSKIYNLYFNSFRVMTSTEPPSTLEANREFVDVLQHLVDSHSDTIPTLAQGFYECRTYMDIDHSATYLDTHLRARIGTRLAAAHHIALTNPIGPEYVGTVQTNCKPSDIVQSCASLVGDICDMKYGVVPTVVLDSGQDVEMAYIPVHIEYIMTELLKNSFRAVIENDTANEPVQVTIVRTGSGVVIRIRDRGGGIPPHLETRAFGFSFSTYDESENEGVGFTTLNTHPGGGGSSIAGLGYGLPLSRAYAEFFGGKLQLQTYHGWGTDVYVTLNSHPREAIGVESVLF